MKKLASVIITLLSLAVVCSFPASAQAAPCSDIGITATGLPSTVAEGIATDVTFTVSGSLATGPITIEIDNPRQWGNLGLSQTQQYNGSPLTYSFAGAAVTTPDWGFGAGSRRISITAPTSCELGDYTIVSTNVATDMASCQVKIVQADPTNPSVRGSGCFTEGPIDVEISATDNSGNPYNGQFCIQSSNGLCDGVNGWITMVDGNYIGPVPGGIPNDRVGGIFGVDILNEPFDTICQDTTPTVRLACTPEERTSGILVNSEPFRLCEQISDTTLKEECEDCAGGTNGFAGVWTAVGCINRDPQVIIVSVLNLGLGMGGGVALLMILAAGFMLTTSQGDPKRTSEAKEMITSAIIGLLFVIFSVAILQFVGSTVLMIPGFGG